MECTSAPWQCVFQRKSLYIEKLPSDKGNPSIHVIFRGVSPKILFLLWSIYDCLFSCTPCPRVMKIKTLGEKIMLISKYDSQFAIRAIPDYEPVCMGDTNLKCKRNVLLRFTLNAKLCFLSSLSPLGHHK